MMTKKVINYFLLLSAILGITFLIQGFILYQYNKPIFGNQITEAYLFNYGFATIGLFLLPRQKERAGFVYLALSTIKFMIFFLFFYPSYKEDYNINHFEFAAFFIPYTVSLTLETFLLVKFLNKLDEGKSSNSNRSESTPKNV